MKNFLKISLVMIGLVLMASCQDERQPNYQYMPNMYEPVGYETYDKVGFLPDSTEAMIPAAGSIARGKMPYTLPNTPEGKELSITNPSPLDSLNLEEDLAVGGELYGVYCAICHGNKGDGQGTLVKREKILGVPSYADPARNITEGDTYHVIYYGLNSMGSYANQLNHKERWQVAAYVNKLKEDLTK